MEQEQKNKYGTVELLLGGLGYLTIDGICTLIDFTGVGLAIAPVIQSFGTASMNWWAWSKGDKNSLKLGRQIAKYAANLLPALPTLTMVFLIEAYIHNHPEKFETAVKAFKATQAIKTAKSTEGGLKEKVKAARTAYAEAEMV